MYGRSGNFSAAAGASQGLQNAMTGATNVMRNTGGQNIWTNRLNQMSQPGAGIAIPEATAAPRLRAADAHLHNARAGLNEGRTFQEGQLADTNLAQYQNRYRQQVIGNMRDDMDRTRQMTANDIGAQATAAGAFGGSRHGLVEAENNRNFAEAVADMSAQQRVAGFDNAQQAAQQDINTRMAAQQLRTGSAGQLGQLNLANAARVDEARAENARNQMTHASNEAQLRAQIEGQNQQNRLAAAQAGLSNATQTRNTRLNAANQLAGMAGQAFDQGNTISDRLAQNGAIEQNMNQQLINAGRNQFGQWAGQPAQSMLLPLQAAAGTPNMSTTTQSNNPGLFGTIGAGVGLMSMFSDRRLKEDVKRVGQTDEGLPIYTYRYKGGDVVHMGVMAQDVEQVKPEAVSTVGGFKAVNYGMI